MSEPPIRIFAIPKEKAPEAPPCVICGAPAMALVQEYVPGGATLFLCEVDYRTIVGDPDEREHEQEEPSA